MIAFHDALEQCYAHQASACPAKGRQAGKTTSAARSFYRLGQHLNDLWAQLLDAALTAYPRGGLSRRLAVLANDRTCGCLSSPRGPPIHDRGKSERSHCSVLHISLVTTPS